MAQLASKYHMSKKILKKAKQTILDYRMVEPRDLIIVAVSGGPDSICLLDILHQLSYGLETSLIVAHFDHGLRPKEDQAETQLVKHLADSLGITFETERAVHLKADTASLEEKAREARYSFLERVREKHNGTKIAFGHNLNDQAETFLMRLLRGSGPAGLSGIPPERNGRIIRPLIRMQREDIILYLNVRGIPYSTDSSNTDAKYLRNRIRHELLPLMMDYQPKLIERLGETADLLREEDSYLDHMAGEWIEKESEQLPDCIAVSILSLKDLPLPFQNRVVRILLKKVNNSLRRIDHGHIKSIIALADSKSPHAMLDLPNHLVVRRIYEKLMFASNEDKPVQGFSYLLDGPGDLFLNETGQTLRVEEKDYTAPDIEAGGYSVNLDADSIQYPLTVRNFNQGDRFVPLGMNGHKKVKKFFIDLKVPYRERPAVPIVLSQGKIVWICKYRIDDRFKVCPWTKKVIKLSLVDPFYK